MKTGRRAAVLLAGAAFLTACARPRPGVPAPAPSANFELVLREVVATAEEDTPVYAEVFVDGRPAGRTQEGPRSREKLWRAELEEGNRLLRFEVWDSTEPARRWPDEMQPRERFIRVEPGMTTKVDLKFYDRGRQYDLVVGRRPR